MKDTGSPRLIHSDIERSISAGSDGCSRLNDQVLKARRIFSALTVVAGGEPLEERPAGGLVNARGAPEPTTWR
jgi:hypothetical protein